MKKVILLLLPALLILSGCGASRQKETRKLAEDYLTKLETIYEDTLTISDKEPEQYGEMYTYFANSSVYQKEFRINVNSDNRVTDAYFSLSLADSAQEACQNAVLEALPSFEGSIESVLNSQLVTSSLSGKRFENIQAAQNACPNVNLIQLTLNPKSGSLSKEDLLIVLNTLKDNTLFSSVTIVGDDMTYEASVDGIYQVGPSGADNGAMIDRREFQ